MPHKRILCLQLEVFTNCAPHMGMCLFMNDLRHEGIDCAAYLINYQYFEGVFEVIENGGFSLICLDSTFTVDMIDSLTEAFPEIPILIGGVNALALLFHTDAAFAVFGPGRRAAREFMAAFFGNKDFSKVTNLFYKDGQQIHYSGRTQHWDLPSELFPYVPFLEWGYVGSERKANANTESVSVVAGTGCPYARSTKSSHRYDIASTLAELGYKPTDTALSRLDDIFNQTTHGCSFCVFQLQEYKAYSPTKTTDILLKQAEYLYRTHNTRAFPIQTENPFPFLNGFLDALLAQEIPLEFVSIRTRPDILVKQKSKLEKALEKAEKHDFHFSVEEVGFESFVEQELKLFNKGLHVQTNMEALELLREMKGRFDTCLSVHVGHGMILFHPWTTIETLSSNLGVMERYPDIFSRFYAVDLTLYSEFLPLFAKIASEGLLAETSFSYGWHYTPKDPLARKALELYQTLFSHFGPDFDISLYRNVLPLLEYHSLENIIADEFHISPE